MSPRIRAALVTGLVAWIVAACDSASTPAPAPAPTPTPAPQECGGQPCCGDPPRPCGEVIETAIGKACTTACDCEHPGLACNDGRCASGTEAVFCCDGCPPTAPAAQRCQHRDGRFATCG